MERIGIRDLRNDTARAVRRARAGERILITVNGVPAAQLGPIDSVSSETTLEDLIAAGLVRPAQVSGEATVPPRPVALAGGRTTSGVLRRHRNRP